MKCFHQNEDVEGVGDALLVTSDMWCVGTDVRKAAFLDILSFSLGAKAIRLRHIAIRVACDNREALSAPENTRNVAIRDKILTTFQKALLVAISLDTSSMTATPDHPNINRVATDVRSDDNVSDLRFHGERDRYYLRLIFTLTYSLDWVPYIINDGHLDRCLLLLERGRSDPLHLAVIFIRIEASKCDLSLHAITREQWGNLMEGAWRELGHTDGLTSCIEALPTLAEHTIKYLPKSDSYRIRGDVARVVDHLTFCGARREIRSAVE